MCHKLIQSLCLLLFLFFISAAFLNCQPQNSNSSTSGAIPSPVTEPTSPTTGTETDTETSPETEPNTESEISGESGETGDDSSVPDVSDTDTEETTEEESSPGIPYGFWGLNGFHDSEGFLDVQTRFGITVFQVASESPSWTVNTFLPLIRESGMKVTLRMTSAPDYSGDFNLEEWKTALSAWIDSGVQEFIDDGTLIGHMILDDIYNFSGTDPTAEDLDEMARYSKEILPGLMTFVRQKATGMPVPVGGTYVYLDACVNQYSAYTGFPDGPIEEYVVEQAATARVLGLGIINGMNIADGGNGTSGQSGWSSGKFAMSAEEITTYGEALLGVPDLLMFLMWEYDGEEVWSDGILGSDYFDQAERQEAIYGLGQIAAASGGGS